MARNSFKLKVSRRSFKANRFSPGHEEIQRQFDYPDDSGRDPIPEYLEEMGDGDDEAAKKDKQST
jgi:hypothetical protein